MSWIPGQPIAISCGQRSTNCHLLWGMVAQCFGLLGFPGRRFVHVAGPYHTGDANGIHEEVWLAFRGAVYSLQSIPGTVIAEPWSHIPNKGP